MTSRSDPDPGRVLAEGARALAPLLAEHAAEAERSLAVGTPRQAARLGGR